MSSDVPTREGIARRYPVTCYFALAFAISWIGALAVAAPKLFRGEALAKGSGLLMFSVMILGPCIAGLVLTKQVNGSVGMSDLFARMRHVNFSGRWYVVLLIPVGLVLTVLTVLQITLSPVYAPNRFIAGLSFGLLAGFFEEIGWTGFAYPKMRQTRSTLAAGVLLGVVWGIWHLPVLDLLGRATPHGAYFLPYFAAFTAAMTGLRVLMCWIYEHTTSVLLVQLLHASATGALVAFSPVRVSNLQETLWYMIYAAALWIVVAILFATGLFAPHRSEVRRLA